MSGTWVHENPGNFSINSYGFRDVEWQLPKEKKYRVAVLGDSFVEALQLDPEFTFPKIIEKRLGNVEMMNFGISGQGQVEELLTYRYDVRPFHPDMVIVCFFPGNDIIDNWRRSKPSRLFPIYAKSDANGVSIVPSPDAAKFAWIRRMMDWTQYHLSLAQRMLDLRRELYFRKQEIFTEPGLWKGAFGNPDGAIADFDQMWDLTEKLFLQLYRDVTMDIGNSQRFLVVCLTEGVQVHGEQRAIFLKKYPNLDPDYSEKRFETFCQSHGIPFLALSPDMIAYNKTTGRLLHGFGGKGNGHFNQDGHRVAAEAISNRLKAILP
jgi:lysophospholipase L1-like esterase